MKVSSNWKNFSPLEPIQGSINFFKYVGIWPSKYKYRFLYIIYGILFQFVFSYAYTSFEVGNAIFVKNMNVMTEQVFVGLAEISMCIRMTNFVAHFKEAKNFLKRIESFELHNQEECDLYKKRLRVFSFVLIFYLSCASFAITFSCFAPLFGDELKFPYPSWYPWDWKNNMVWFWITYLYQFVGVSFLAHTLVRLQNYQLYCMICCGAQIEILGMRLMKLGYENSSNGIKNRRTENKPSDDHVATLIECLKKHKSIMNFVSDIERVFNIPFLFQLFASSVIFCLIGFQIIIMDDPSNNTIILVYYICYFATMTNEIFLPCYFGTQLTAVNNDLSIAVYSSNWPELSHNFKQIIILFLEYLKRPKIMMSGKIFTLTLFSFLTVINRSYSMLAVLRSVIK